MGRRSTAEQAAGKQSIRELSKYRRQDVLDLKAAFDAHDVDGSGFVTAAQLIATMKSRGLTKHGSVVYSAARAVDKEIELDSKIDFGGFLRLYYPHATAAEAAALAKLVQQPEAVAAPVAAPPAVVLLDEDKLAELGAMFARYDLNKNGTLDKHELTSAISACGYQKHEVQALLSKIMVGRRCLSFHEFATAMAEHVMDD